MDLKTTHIKIPIDLIIRAHAAIPPELRVELEACLATYKVIHGDKEHIAEGFTLGPVGELGFDPILYDEAICRGKIETRTRKAKEAYEDLKSQLEHLSTMGTTQKQLGTEVGEQKLSTKLCHGAPISDESQRILEQMKALPSGLLPSGDPPSE